MGKVTATVVKGTAPKRVRVSDEDFLTAYLAAHKVKGCLQDVADTLGLKVGSVSVRATAMRKAGFPVPKFDFNRGKGGGGNKRDADAINRLLEAYKTA